MKPLNADLHCHSTVSDGLLAPAEVVRRAKDNGVELLALTDHDELGGLVEGAGDSGRNRAALCRRGRDFDFLGRRPDRAYRRRSASIRAMQN
jgi:histidinol phosphatase-like PHP family hydrolase